MAAAVPVVAASRTALAMLASPDGAARRARLHDVARRVRRGLRALGHDVDECATEPIIPFVVGDDRRAVAWTEALLTRGLLVQAIRPPTVPEGTARLRIAVSALHSDADVDALIAAIAAGA